MSEDLPGPGYWRSLNNKHSADIVSKSWIPPHDYAFRHSGATRSLKRPGRLGGGRGPDQSPSSWRWCNLLLVCTDISARTFDLTLCAKQILHLSQNLNKRIYIRKCERLEFWTELCLLSMFFVSPYILKLFTIAWEFHIRPAPKISQYIF